jgi:hypothetical protein
VVQPAPYSSVSIIHAYEGLSPIQSAHTFPSHVMHARLLWRLRRHPCLTFTFSTLSNGVKHDPLKRTQSRAQCSLSFLSPTAAPLHLPSFLQTFSPSTFTNPNLTSSLQSDQAWRLRRKPNRTRVHCATKVFCCLSDAGPTRIGRRGNFSTLSDCLVGEVAETKKKLYQQLHRLRPTPSPLSLVDLDQLSESRQELQVSSPGTVSQTSDLALSIVTKSRSTKKRSVKRKGRAKQEHAMQSESILAQSTGTGSDDSTSETTSSLAPNSDADNVASPSPQAAHSRKRPLDTPDFAPSKSVHILLLIQPPLRRRWLTLLTLDSMVGLRRNKRTNMWSKLKPKRNSSRKWKSNLV